MWVSSVFERSSKGVSIVFLGSLRSMVFQGRLKGVLRDIQRFFLLGEKNANLFVKGKVVQCDTFYRQKNFPTGT